MIHTTRFSTIFGFKHSNKTPEISKPEIGVCSVPFRWKPLMMHTTMPHTPNLQKLSTSTVIYLKWKCMPSLTCEHCKDRMFGPEHEVCRTGGPVSARCDILEQEHQPYNVMSPVANKNRDTLGYCFMLVCKLLHEGKRLVRNAKTF